MISKICRICGEDKILEEYPSYKTSSGNISYRSKCKTCTNEYNKKYYSKEKTRERYLNNKQRFIDSSRKWQDKNKEVDRENKRKYNELNKEKHYANNREYCHFKYHNDDIFRTYKRFQQINYRLKNPDKFKMYAKNRRVRKLSVEGSFTSSEINKLSILQNNTCIYCGTDISLIFHIDHIVPLSKGGCNDINNIQLLCPSCNCSKKDKDLLDYIRYLHKFYPHKYLYFINKHDLCVTTQEA